MEKKPIARTGPRLRLAIVAGLVITAAALHHAGVMDWFAFHDRAEAVAHRWWFAGALVLIKAGMYVFALPGSATFWIAGALYPPAVATAILVAGGTAGSLGAYAVARMASEGHHASPRRANLTEFLRRNSDLATLTALRTLPGFPHSVLNYGCGVLKVPIGSFAVSTVVGFGVKAYLYSSAIRSAATAEDLSDVLGADTLIPLIGLALLLIAASLFHRRAAAGRGGDGAPRAFP